MSLPADQAEQRLEQRAKEVFDDSVASLDGRTRSKLTQARHAALDELQRTRAAPARRFWMPAGGLAAAAVLAVMITLWPDTQRTSPQGGLPLEDLDIVADADNLELLEDVEFYTWLEDEAGQPSSHSG